MDPAAMPWEGEVVELCFRFIGTPRRKSDRGPFHLLCASQAAERFFDLDDFTFR